MFLTDLQNVFYFIIKKITMYRYGIENESIARNAVQEKLNIEIKSAGLFILKSLPYLAASPDGLINNDYIIEIKCPPSIKEFTPEEAVQNGKLKCIYGKLRRKTCFETN